MQSRQRLEPGTADLQEHDRVDGQEGGGRAQVELERAGLAGGGRPQHGQGLLQGVGANVDRRDEGQVGGDAVERAVP